MSDQPRAFQRGSAFRDGKLYLFTERGVLVVRTWPDPRAWWRGQRCGWRGVVPRGLDLGAPERLVTSPEPSRRLRCMAEAFSVVPVEQRLEAARYGELGWAMHNLFARVPGALELSRNCPALAAGLAQAAVMRPRCSRPWRSARRLLRSPGPATARRVARWLGFDASRGVVRVLRRLDPGLCTARNIRILRRALADDDLRRSLFHTRRLAEPLLVLLMVAASSPVRVGGALYRTVAEAPRREVQEALHVVLDLVELWCHLQPPGPLPRLVSRGQVERLFVRGLRELDSPVRLQALAEERGGLPAPPLGGAGLRGLLIQPLSSVGALVEEGARMGHCIGSRSYVKDCLEGRGYAYRVSASEPGLSCIRGTRATAWVVPSDRGGWILAALHAAGNEEPVPLVREALDEWLGFHRPPLGPMHSWPPPQDRGRTLRVRRYRGRGIRVASPAPQRPPPPLGEQLGLAFAMPF